MNLDGVFVISCLLITGVIQLIFTAFITWGLIKYHLLTGRFLTIPEDLLRSTWARNMCTIIVYLTPAITATLGLSCISLGLWEILVNIAPCFY